MLVVEGDAELWAGQSPEGTRDSREAGGWLEETLTELWISWPKKWDDYMSVDTWIYRMEPDDSLPNKASRTACFSDANPAHPYTSFLLPWMTRDQWKPWKERWKTIADETPRILPQRQANINRSQELHNERILILLTSPGAKPRVGDKVLVRESSSTLYHDGVHPKLPPGHFTGPWSVERVVREGLSFIARLHGRKVRQRTVSATEMIPFHSRPKEIRHELEDEFAQFGLPPDLGLVQDSVVDFPLYTLISRRGVRREGGSSAWTWEYRERYQDGTESPFAHR